MDVITQPQRKTWPSEEVAVPPLHNGDHLTRAEFERRYAAHQDVKKAELIEGVVYVPSPVSLEHSHRHAVVMGWLLHYCAATPGLRLLDNATVKLDADNEVQPDAALCVAKRGQTKVAGSYLRGAPELIVEIAATSATYDLHEKLNVYRRSGVREYVVLLTHERQTLWFRLNEGRYDPVEPATTGSYHSEIFPGLSFATGLFWADESAGLLNALQATIATSEHARFVKSLSIS